MSFGAIGAATAASAHQAKLREEEERLTLYSQNDLSGWEFKIVRSHTRITGDRFRQLCEDEKRNGWELMEKFDDYRFRFKRPVERRAQDGTTFIDPYRTHVGISDAGLVIVILGGVFAIMAIVSLLVFGRF